ncbi:MAG: hypothetical protein IJ679_01310 [Lachnospiraceae bacterium]|nr:hypothetical protein [Lachnospiraceae bacterium]
MDKKRAALIVQSVLWVMTATVFIASVVSIYMSGMSLKAEDPMADIYSIEAIGQRAVIVLPFLGICIANSVLLVVLGMKDENADKAALHVDITKNTEGSPWPADKIRTARMAGIALAVICIIIGIFNGSMRDVFIKASKICTECIGLG